MPRPNDYRERNVTDGFCMTLMRKEWLELVSAKSGLS